MLNQATLVAFVPSLDLDRAAAFYSGVLALEVEQRSDYACVLRSGSVELRVTKVGQLEAAPFTILGWMVDDIREVMVALQAKGVIFERYLGMDQDDDGIWISPHGDQVAWFRDPDGNTLSLTQRHQR